MPFEVPGRYATVDFDTMGKNRRISVEFPQNFRRISTRIPQKCRRAGVYSSCCHAAGCSPPGTCRIPAGGGHAGSGTGNVGKQHRAVAHRDRQGSRRARTMNASNLLQRCNVRRVRGGRARLACRWVVVVGGLMLSLTALGAPQAATLEVTSLADPGTDGCDATGVPCVRPLRRPCPTTPSRSLPV